MTVAEACDEFGCSSRKIYYMIKDGEIQAKKLGGRTLIVSSSLEAALVDITPSKK